MRFLRFLLPLLAFGFIAAANKPPVSLRFHTEINPNAGDQFALSIPLPDSNRKITLSKVALISEYDVVAIYPFPAADGTMGCAFKLDAHGRIGIDTISLQNHGSLLVGFLNNRLISAVEIDRHVTDGVLYVARGLRPEEIALLSKSFPVLGDPKHKKKKKDEYKPIGSVVDPDVSPLPQVAPTSTSNSSARGD
jgi:hypothetical protein